MESGSVVFTGQLRTPELFQQSIGELEPLRRRGLVGSVVFSTWTGEVSRAAARRLRRSDVRVIETPQPDDPGPGNVWCQMRSLEVGLAHTPPGGLVLKTRTDVRIHPALIERLFDDAGYLTLGRGTAGGPFERRVWVPWFEITKPFYLADECFCGAHRDVQALVNYDSSYDALWSLDAGMTHVRRFVHPFRAREPLFEEYLAGGTNLAFGARRFAMLAQKLGDPWFRRVLAAYYDVLGRFFRVDSACCRSAVQFREWSSPDTTIDPQRFRANFAPACSWRPSSGHIYAYDERWLGRIAAGAFGDVADPSSPAWDADPALQETCR